MKLLIWGTGNLAKKIIENGVAGDIRVFIETNKIKNEWEGRPIYIAYSIPKQYDFIVDDNTYSREVYEICG